ncbi:type II toxin-antitoxin system death-on-curing family toxin [Pleurocapsa sp. PCC 7319]|uniref:type II toxin-antitoxin system death-on-curing family toxin n=1 Tax=Pleurocapsa sp. PCC 7319 TaxID=118161 RepID=UPI0003471DD7|nr:type II toxin-antitoxin system death-on-curing family toxin [Pleurocapsa sp. PCC 7319]
MIRYPSLMEVIELHRQIITQSGGTLGILDLNILQSTITKPRMSFAGKDFYPTLIDKAATLGFAIIVNHPFVDGNQRTGHAAMAIFLAINGVEINADVEEQVQKISAIASGKLKRDDFVTWVKTHIAVQS